MSLSTFFAPVHLAQIFALALPIFNLVAFLWLACTVWLNGNRQSHIARVGVVGLGLAALFFFLQALLFSGSPVRTSGIMTPEFLWHLIWLPALGSPYIWFVVGLYYAALMNKKWRRRRPFMLVIGALLGLLVLALLIWHRSTFTFVEVLRLLAYGNVSGAAGSDHTIFSPFVLIPFLFLCFVTFCAIGPWFTPGRVGRLLGTLWQSVTHPGQRVSLPRLLAEAYWNDQEKDEQLAEPLLSWQLARSILLLAALLMVGLTISLSVLSVHSLLNWLNSRQPLSPPSSLSAELTALPLNLLLVNIFATGLVAVMILLIGYSVVRHGILIERPLVRRGFFEQWRGIAIVAATLAIFIALLVDLTRSNLGALLLITALATGTYALFTWSSYTAHDRYITLLRPFLSRVNLRHWLNTDLQKTEQNMEDLFSHLCKDVLGVKWARLVVLSGPVRRSFNYRWPAIDDRSIEQALIRQESDVKESYARQMLVARNSSPSRLEACRMRVTVQGLPVICWLLPIYDELGLVAKLYLGPRRGGSSFTDEDMHLAFACGQRILDTLRDHEAMLAVAALLRRRIVDVKLLGAQQRRVLHDEILPQMHLALLHLETARSLLRSGDEQNEQGKHEQEDQEMQLTRQRTAQVLSEAVEGISTAHRRLAAMMRAMTTSAPHRLERDGMMHAIYEMVTNDFRQAFDEVEWDVADETMHRIDEMVPPAIAELIFAAVQEALRNAARHARGTDIHRRLCITIRAYCDPHIEILVADDGVGVLSASSSTTGTGGGLITHSALLAIAGGSLTVKSAPAQGVTVRIFLPVEALR
ncbi:MAG: hypothetical protein IMW89_21465 [Ktedonobacteraceae bacterium]|nr:hypothetical protein [Ktedonobacteraceae bacterium]